MIVQYVPEVRSLHCGTACVPCNHATRPRTCCCLNAAAGTVAAEPHRVAGECTFSDWSGASGEMCH
jgi:hypothetical protein